MSTNIVHTEVDSLRLQMMKAIMGTEDVAQLRAWCQHMLPEQPDEAGIPTAEIQSGVTLEEIEAGQTVRRVSFEEHMAAVGQVEWDMSLDEMLDGLD